MDILHTFIQFILHLDVQLAALAVAMGPWVYALLFLIVFCETGLVVTPFLPGDSLIFAAGTLAARGGFNIHLLIVVLIAAALCGDNVNYWLGRTIGARLFSPEKSRWFNRQYLDKTHAFYERHGSKAVIIARFVPIIRTFSPFVAGFAAMSYRRFLCFSVIAALLWAAGIGYLSYAFGNLPFVQRHFNHVIFAIILLSLLPPVIEWLRHRLRAREVV